MHWLRMLTGVLGRIANVPTAGIPVQAERSTGRSEENSNQSIRESAVSSAVGKQTPTAAATDSSPEAYEIVRVICAEVFAARPSGFRSLKLTNSPRYVALKSESPDLQVAVAWAAYRGEPDRNSPHYWRSLNDEAPRREIFAQALRKDLPFKPEQLHVLLKEWLDLELTWNGDYSGRVLIGAVERLAKRQPLPETLCGVLREISAVGHYLNCYMSDLERISLMHRIGRLGNPALEAHNPLLIGAFARELRRWGDTLSPAAQAAWLDLVYACAEISGKSTPSVKWRETARSAIQDIGPAELTAYLIEVMDKSTDQPPPWTIDSSFDLLKGLVWITPLLDHSVLAAELGRFADYIPSMKLTNAAIWALSEMAGESRAAAELFRLRAEFRQQDTRRLIDRRLAALAEKSGTTVGALEDFSLPYYELNENSQFTMAFGKARVELTVEPARIRQKWTNSAGKEVKGPPAEVREGFAKDLATYRQRAEDIEAARQIQLRRLEESWIEERNWTFAEWEKHFLDHPLRGPLVDTLIWRIGEKSVMTDADLLKDIAGTAHTFAPNTRVQLWHPLHCDPTEVLEWRARILATGLTQPIKQTHREIYVLTDAERTTRTYSNRFAAHILRQHQFTKICQARGWRYKLQGDWDGWNLPTRALPTLSAEYHVETLEGGATAHSGVYLHLTSDQVRFLDAERRPIALEEVSPIVFSEVMRDVDLFVAVTSVANDPNWADGGPNGPHRNYWQEWAFGELGQTAVTRKELAHWLVPKLSIANKLEITDKFLVVQGKRQKYAIHFGSSNIQILPSNRYLCIVPAGAPKEARNIKLPFEGDSMFSTILSKAFLLVDEDKIRDETILRQL